MQKKMPMKAHENILIFYKKLPVYHPQMTNGHSPVHSYTKHTTDGSNYGKTKIGISGGGSTQRYPRDVLKFSWDTQKSKIHSTQKPIAACEYFIRTYTNPGDIVLEAQQLPCPQLIPIGILFVLRKIRIYIAKQRKGFSKLKIIYNKRLQSNRQFFLSEKQIMIACFSILLLTDKIMKVRRNRL